MHPGTLVAGTLTHNVTSRKINGTDLKVVIHVGRHITNKIKNEPLIKLKIEADHILFSTFR